MCYGGRSLHREERKWTVADQECLAVVEGIRVGRSGTRGLDNDLSKYCFIQYCKIIYTVNMI